MAKYQIIQNGRTITPPENISQVYHGAHLIWERAKKNGEFFVEKIFESSKLKKHVFSKNGVIIPQVVYKTHQEVYFDLYGKESIIDFSGVLNSVSEPGVVQHEEFAEFVLADVPTYAIKAAQFRGDSGWPSILETPTRDYIIDFRRESYSPKISDTKSQWGVKPQVLLASPTIITSESGAGIYPLSRFYGYIDGAEKPSFFSYIQKNELHIADYCVLAVCGNDMICGEKLRYDDLKKIVYGEISVRGIDGKLKKTLMPESPIGDTFSDSISYTHPLKHFHYVGEKLFYSSFNTTSKKWEINAPDVWKLNVEMNPLNVAHALDFFIPINSGAIGLSAFKGEKDSGTTIPLQDSRTGELYTVYANQQYGGAYYVDKDGSLYVIAKTEKRDIYALVRITRR